MTQDIKTGIITVVKPVKGSPADGSGLKKGDVLIKVGNYKVKTSDALDDIVKKIRCRRNQGKLNIYKKSDNKDIYIYKTIH